MSKFLEYFNRFFYPQVELKVIKSQQELIKLLACGYTLKEIANKTNKKYFNIQKRTQKLYEKFGVNNRGDLIRKAIEYKIITTKDIKPLFKKRFTRIKNSIYEIKLLAPLSERAFNFLKLKSSGKSDSEIIQIMGLYGTYPIWEIKRELYSKLDSTNILQVIYKPVKLEII